MILQVFVEMLSDIVAFGRKYWVVTAVLFVGIVAWAVQWSPVAVFSMTVEEAERVVYEASGWAMGLTCLGPLSTACFVLVLANKANKATSKLCALVGLALLIPGFIGVLRMDYLFAWWVIISVCIGAAGAVWGAVRFIQFQEKSVAEDKAAKQTAADRHTQRAIQLIEQGETPSRAWVLARNQIEEK